MMTRLENRYTKINKNLAFVRFATCTIKEGERMCDYVARLQSLANIANKIGDDHIRERLIADTKIMTNFKKFHDKLIHDTDSTLDTLIDWQSTRELQDAMRQKVETASTSLNYVSSNTLQVPRHRHNSSSSNHSTSSTKSNTSQRPRRTRRGNRNNSSKGRCWYCNRKWPHQGRCPADNQKCNQCNETGHFKSCCPDIQPVHEINKEEEEPDSANSSIHVITKINLFNRKCPKQLVCLNNNDLIQAYPDTGAHANVIPKCEYDKLQHKPSLKPTNIKLLSFDSDQYLNVAGEFNVRMTWEGVSKMVTFVVLNTTKIVDTIISYESMLEFDLDFNKVLKFPIKTIGYINTHVSTRPKLMTKSDIISKMPNLFEKRTGKAKTNPVHIEYDINMKPSRVPPHFIPLKLMEPTKAKLDKWLLDDIAYKLQANDEITWVSSLYPIEKNPEKSTDITADDVRIVINCKNINKAITRQRCIQLPDQRQVEYDLNGATIFSKIDIRDAYSTLELSTDSAKLFTFSTPWGLYRLKRLVQGVSVASDIYQEFIEQNFGHIANTKRCVDDFLIYGKPDSDKINTPEEKSSAIKNHNIALQQVLNRCGELNLTLNESKCKFSTDNVIFYGNEISAKGFRPLRSKVESFLNGPNPTNKHELRSFMGMCSNWIKRMPEIVEEAKYLNTLRKKNSIYEWTDNHTKALNVIKEKLITGHLTHFNPKRKTIIYCDAGPSGISAILTQTDENGTNWLIACATHCFSDIEMRYSQVEKEMLAIVWTIKHFKYECLANDVIIRSDSLSSVKIMNSTNKAKESKSLRILSWLSKLPGGNYTIEHVPGHANIADYLSRCHTNVKAPSFNDLSTIYSIEPYNLEITMNDIIEQTKLDQTLVEITNCIKASTKPPSSNKYSTLFHDCLSLHENGCVLKDEVILLPEALINKAITIAHAGHNGTQAVIDVIRKRYFFDKLSKRIRDYIKTCMPCQANTGHPATEPMIIQPAPQNNNELVSIDFSSKTPSNNYVIVWVDERSKTPIMKITKGLTTNDAITVLKKIFKETGVIPKTIKSDNGPAFASKQFKQFATDYKFTHMKITPIWPNANGGCESRMKIINKSIRCANANNKKDWLKILDEALKIYKATTHPSTGYSPNEMTGKQDEIKLASFHKNRIVDPKEADETNWQAKLRYKAYADKTKKAKSKPIEIGDTVLHKWVKTNKHQSKFDPKPYRVTKQTGTMIEADRPDHHITRNKSLFKKISPITTIQINMVFDPLAKRRARLAQERAIAAATEQTRVNTDQATTATTQLNVEKTASTATNEQQNEIRHTQNQKDHHAKTNTEKQQSDNDKFTNHLETNDTGSNNSSHVIHENEYQSLEQSTNVPPENQNQSTESDSSPVESSKAKKKRLNEAEKLVECLKSNKEFNKIPTKNKLPRTPPQSASENQAALPKEKD
jgi:hypothetical protein